MEGTCMYMIFNTLWSEIQEDIDEELYLDILCN